MKTWHKNYEINCLKNYKKSIFGKNLNGQFSEFHNLFSVYVMKLCYDNYVMKTSWPLYLSIVTKQVHVLLLLSKEAHYLEKNVNEKNWNDFFMNKIKFYV